MHGGKMSIHEYLQYIEECKYFRDFNVVVGYNEMKCACMAWQWASTKRGLLLHHDEIMAATILIVRIVGVIVDWKVDQLGSQ
jgi:hypothetical protein